jgi:hypothetical protein
LIPLQPLGDNNLDEEEIPLKTIRDKIRQSLDVNGWQAAQAAAGRGNGGSILTTSTATAAAGRGGGSILATSAAGGIAGAAAGGGKAAAHLPPIPSSAGSSRAGNASAGAVPSILDLAAGNGVKGSDSNN